jgi:FkbM family methyltransferase
VNVPPSAPKPGTTYSRAQAGRSQEEEWTVVEVTLGQYRVTEKPGEGGAHVIGTGLLFYTGGERNVIADAMIAGGYERNEADFMRRVVRPGMHAIDVGAHLGVHTLQLAVLVGDRGSVTALEPLEEYTTCLARSLRANGLTDRVRIVQAAAGDTAGSRSIVVRAPGLEQANAHLAPERLAFQEGRAMRRVSMMTLDDCIVRRPVGFIKLDVEGAESLVIRGAARLLADDRPIVLADLHPHLMMQLDAITPEALIADMARQGYECRLLGAGVPGDAIDAVPSRGVTQVLFLPAGPRV